MALARFVHRPILVAMITLTILVVGGIAFTRLPLQMLPDGLSSDNVWIGVQAPGMTPEEVERTVYAPLEGELLTIPGVREVSGRCQLGRLQCNVELSPNLDPRLASAEVRDRIQRARLAWPPECDRYWTWRESADSIPLMFFSLMLPDSEQRWYDLIEREVVPKLESLDGVGQVMFFGMIDQTVRIFFDRDKLRAHRKNVRTILTGLNNDNVSVPVGEIHDGDSVFLVRADLGYRDLETIRDLPIGDGLKMRDVASVERVRSVRDTVARVNGKYSFSGLIRKTAGANTIDTARRVRAFMDDLVKDPRFAGLVPVWMFDQGEFIAESAATLQTSAWQGGALAVVILLLFLRRLKMTLAVALSLPLSLLVAVGVMFFEGESLNVVSMAALTISAGMLVDNSIVVLENVYRLRQLGRTWSQACIEGVQQVGLAVTLSTLTTVVVFLPLLFSGESPTAQAMLAAFGIPLCTALLASLFVALILLPAMTRAIHGRSEAAALPSPGRGLVAWLVRGQEFLLRPALRHRWAAVLFVTALGGGALWLIQNRLERGVEGGDGMRGQVSVFWDFPTGTTLAEANETSARYESWFEERRERFRIKDVSARFGRRNATINLNFPKGTPQKWVKEVVKAVRAELPKSPGLDPEVHSRVGGGDEEAKEGDNGFMVQLTGRDSEYLRQWANTLKDELLAKKLAVSVDLGRAGAQDELRVQVSRDRLQELQVEPGMLFGIVSAGLRGQQVGRLRDADGNDVRLIAEYAGAADMELKDLKELQIWSQTMGFQRLADLAGFDFVKGYSTIFRRNGVLTMGVGGSRPDGLGMREFTAGLTGIMRSMAVPRGYAWSMGGEMRQQDEDMRVFAEAFAVSLVLVILVMGVLFESVLLPLAAGSTMPVAVLGGLVGLIATGKMFDGSTFIGLMILAGVIVNNGIVLLDHIVRLRGEGLDRERAIFQGMRDRVRPILMTALTTIAGLVPMLFTDVASQRGISYVGMATVVATGLFLGTFLTPLVVPLSYTLLDDLRQWARRVHVGAAKRPRPSCTATAPRHG